MINYTKKIELKASVNPFNLNPYRINNGFKVLKNYELFILENKIDYLLDFEEFLKLLTQQEDYRRLDKNKRILTCQKKLVKIII